MHWDPILIGVVLQQPRAGPRCAHLPLWGEDQPHPTSPELPKPGTAWGCRGGPGCATERVGEDRAERGDLRLRLAGLPSPAPALPLWDALLARAAPGPRCALASRHREIASAWLSIPGHVPEGLVALDGTAVPGVQSRDGLLAPQLCPRGAPGIGVQHLAGCPAPFPAPQPAWIPLLLAQHRPTSPSSAARAGGCRGAVSGGRRELIPSGMPQAGAEGPPPARAPAALGFRAAAAPEQRQGQMAQGWPRWAAAPGVLAMPWPWVPPSLRAAGWEGSFPWAVLVAPCPAATGGRVAPPRQGWAHLGGSGKYLHLFRGVSTALRLGLKWWWPRRLGRVGSGCGACLGAVLRDVGCAGSGRGGTGPASCGTKYPERLREGWGWPCPAVGRPTQPEPIRGAPGAPRKLQSPRRGCWEPCAHGWRGSRRCLPAQPWAVPWDGLAAARRSGAGRCLHSPYFARLRRLQRALQTRLELPA